MLNRTALRVATLLALTNGRKGEGMTLAGINWEDTRLTDILEGNKGKNIPTGIVYTNDSSATNDSNQRFNPNTEETILELEHAMTEVREDSMGAPISDPELEAKLDLFTSQTLLTLTQADTKWTRLFWKVCKRIISINTNRLHSEDGLQKFALRTMIIRCEIQPDCQAAPGLNSELPDLSYFLEANPGGTAEQVQKFTDRIAAACEIPDPLSTVIKELEMECYKDLLAGVSVIPQECKFLRTNFLASAPTGPYERINQAEDNNITNPSTIVLANTQYTDDSLDVINELEIGETGDQNE